MTLSQRRSRTTSTRRCSRPTTTCGRMHKTLRMSPAMAGWRFRSPLGYWQLVALVEAAEVHAEARLLQKARSGLAYVVKTLTAFAH